MERWVKLLLGTFFSSIAIVIFFLIYDRIMVYFRRKRHDGKDAKVFPFKQIYRKSKKEKKNSEIERVLLDEYATLKHEVLCVCMETRTKAVALCLFLLDREVEWYIDEFPECCVTKSDDEDYKSRNALAAVAHWGPKFTYAEAVNLLSQDGELVRNVGKPGSRQWRSFYQFEKKHSFRLFLQWEENYVTGEAASDELWETAVLVARNMLTDGEDALQDLPMRQWSTKRVHLSNESFHMVPHPGDITPVESTEKKDKKSVNNNESDFEGSQLSLRTFSYADERPTSLASDRTQSLVDECRSWTESRSRSLADDYNRSLAEDLRKSLADEGRKSLAKDVELEKISDEEDEVFQGDKDGEKAPLLLI